MGIRTYVYTIELLTPTIITSSLGYRGMSYSVVTDYIPGSIVRGALFTKMLMERLANERDLVEEARNPKHSLAPALFVPRELSNALPHLDVAFAHSLTFAFKGSKEVFSLGIERFLDLVSKLNNVEEALEYLLRETILKIDRGTYGVALRNPRDVSKLFRCSTEMKPVCGSTIARSGSSWIVVEPSKGIYVENAVDRARGSAAHGALYAYEYLEPGSRFVGLLTIDERSRVFNAIQSMQGSCITVRLGRGLGRGYGLAKLCIHKLGEDVLGKLCEVEVGVENYVVLYAASPLASLGNVPKLPEISEEIELEVLDEIVARLRILGIVCRNVVKYSGWSYRSGTPKLPIKALAPGALIIAKVLEIRSMDGLKLLPIAGVGKLSSQGFNFVRLLTKDFVEVVNRWS